MTSKKNNEINNLATTEELLLALVGYDSNGRRSNLKKMKVSFEKRMHAAEQGMYCDTSSLKEMLEDSAKVPLEELLKPVQMDFINKFGKREYEEHPDEAGLYQPDGRPVTYGDAADYLKKVRGSRELSDWPRLATALLGYIWERFTNEVIRRAKPDDFYELGYRELIHHTFPAFKILLPAYLQASAERCEPGEDRDELESAYEDLIAPLLDILQYKAVLRFQPYDDTKFPDVATLAYSIQGAEDCGIFDEDENFNLAELQYFLLVAPYTSKNTNKVSGTNASEPSAAERRKQSCR